MTIRKIDFNSLMTNDDDPYLCEMADKLLKDPRFIKILEDNGIKVEEDNE